MVLPAVLAAAAPALISGIGSVFQNSAAQSAAKEQMAFQKRMSDTSYQRGVADLRKAGLNPMLAYSQGGASSAAGASYVPQNVGEAATRAYESGANSAGKVNVMAEQLANLKADTALKSSSDKAAAASAIASLEQAKLASENSATVAALRPFQAEKALYDAGISGNVLDVGTVESKYLKTQGGNLARTLALGGKDAADMSSALRNVPLGQLINDTFDMLTERTHSSSSTFYDADGNEKGGVSTSSSSRRGRRR